MMKSSRSLVLSALALAGALAFSTGCTQPYSYNPFHEEHFVPTPPPADFAVVIEENDATYFARRHVRQVVTLSDMMSRTTYETLRDYNNTVASKYETDTPLNHDQVQNMWNQVVQNHLLDTTFTWTYWYSSPDAYKTDTRTLQIRANGQTKVYKNINHWSSALEELVLETQAVRLPISQNAKAVEPYRPTPVAPAETAQPVPTDSQPTASPATPNVQSTTPEPTTLPVLPAPATQPLPAPPAQPMTEPAAAPAPTVNAPAVAPVTDAPTEGTAATRNQATSQP